MAIKHHERNHGYEYIPDTLNRITTIYSELKSRLKKADSPEALGELLKDNQDIMGKGLYDLALVKLLWEQFVLLRSDFKSQRINQATYSRYLKPIKDMFASEPIPFTHMGEEKVKQILVEIQNYSF